MAIYGVLPIFQWIELTAERVSEWQNRPLTICHPLHMRAIGWHKKLSRGFKFKAVSRLQKLLRENSWYAMFLAYYLAAYSMDLFCQRKLWEENFYWSFEHTQHPASHLLKGLRNTPKNLTTLVSQWDSTNLTSGTMKLSTNCHDNTTKAVWSFNRFWHLLSLIDNWIFGQPNPSLFAAKLLASQQLSAAK